MSGAPNNVQNCHLDKTNMDKTSQHPLTLSEVTFPTSCITQLAPLFYSTLMAKMKSADSIYLAVGLEPTGQLVSCSALNQLSLDLAVAAASPAALARMEARGRNLSLGPDVVMGWGGVPWELNSLQWTEVEEGTVQLTSHRLTSGIGHI